MLKRLKRKEKIMFAIRSVSHVVYSLRMASGNNKIDHEKKRFETKWNWKRAKHSQTLNVTEIEIC